LFTVAIAKSSSIRKSGDGRSPLLSVLPFGIEIHRRFADMRMVFDRFGAFERTQLSIGGLLVRLSFSTQP
jgi:hypothetical protein